MPPLFMDFATWQSLPFKSPHCDYGLLLQIIKRNHVTWFYAKPPLLIYADLLKDEEIIATLSCIKSTWTSDVGQTHAKINADYKLKQPMDNSKSRS